MACYFLKRISLYTGLQSRSSDRIVEHVNVCSHVSYPTGGWAKSCEEQGGLCFLNDCYNFTSVDFTSGCPPDQYCCVSGDVSENGTALI